MKKQVVVIGLGRFGRSVCKQLYDLGHEVLAIDIKEERVNEVSNYSYYAVLANASDENALKNYGVKNFDYAIVAIGDNIESSILCTLILKDMGLKEVWVKARDPHHRKILEKVGADRIIQPEKEMGVRIANQLDSGNLLDYIEISNEYSIVELVATEKNSGKSLVQLDVRAKFGCTILAIKRKGNVNISPMPDDVILKGDILVVMGQINDLKRFEKKGF
ncbi:potassium channel family protein [Oceanobacillus damuensis]|uniref:potassium channel family protein n=1 Tax=Oceanobacillus damuensis TaxID=937928 RepID=UPI00082F2EE6|nr:TrkA family potassium uptake protein [Oceanobacillus damuensis]